MSRRPIKPAIDQQNLTPSLGPADDKKDRSLDLGVGAGTGVGGSADIGVGSGIGGVPVGGGGVGMVVDVDNTHTTTPATTSKKRRSHAQGSAYAGGPSSAPSSTAKRPRTNTPWTAAEEQRLKNMRDAGNTWSEIAKTFPTRTEGSVKKHWYKDMHYAEFGEEESAALFAAIREYDTNKWKVIGQKVGKPAKACEQYAKEHFSGKG